VSGSAGDLRRVIWRCYDRSSQLTVTRPKPSSDDRFDERDMERGGGCSSQRGESLGSEKSLMVKGIALLLEFEICRVIPEVIEMPVKGSDG
jgi:hypothetical protein